MSLLAWFRNRWNAPRLTKALVIYDVDTLDVRRIIVAEYDIEYPLFHLQTVGDGENWTYLIFPDGDPTYRSSLANAQDAVYRATRRTV